VAHAPSSWSSVQAHVVKQLCTKPSETMRQNK
jgi:hypothetical protein